MSKPHIAERLCNSQLFSAGFRVWSTLLSVQQVVGDSQVLGSTRNKQYSSATTAAAIFILGTFSAQSDPHCISALLHFTGHRYPCGPFQPSSRQERWRGWRQAMLPLALCWEWGRAELQHSRSKWVQRRCVGAKERDPRVPSIASPEARFPQTLYPGPRDQSSWGVKKS